MASWGSLQLELFSLGIIDLFVILKILRLCFVSVRQLLQDRVVFRQPLLEILWQIYQPVFEISYHCFLLRVDSGNKLGIFELHVALREELLILGNLCLIYFDLFFHAFNRNLEWILDDFKLVEDRV
jgi:hypothetical protein